MKNSFMGLSADWAQQRGKIIELEDKSIEIIHTETEKRIYVGGGRTMECQTKPFPKGVWVRFPSPLFEQGSCMWPEILLGSWCLAGEPFISKQAFSCAGPELRCVPASWLSGTRTLSAAGRSPHLATLPPTGFSLDELQEVQLPLIPKNLCQLLYGYSSFILPDMLCAGDIMNIKTVCEVCPHLIVWGLGLAGTLGSGLSGDPGVAIYRQTMHDHITPAVGLGPVALSPVVARQGWWRPPSQPLCT
jgi:hypothetical protein